MLNHKSDDLYEDLEGGLKQKLTEETPQNSDRGRSE